MHEWLSGERPFHGSFTEIAVNHQLVAPASLCEKVPSLSVEVEQVVMTALAKDPKGRFGSMQAFATALEQASPAVRDVPSVHLNEMAPSTPQGASSVPDPPLQNAPESSQTELEQERPLLEAPELLRENGEAHAVPASGISSLTGESDSLDAVAAQDEKVNPWGLGKRQMIAMVIGIV